MHREVTPPGHRRPHTTGAGRRRSQFISVESESCPPRACGAATEVMQELLDTARTDRYRSDIDRWLYAHEERQKTSSGSRSNALGGGQSYGQRWRRNVGASTIPGGRFNVEDEQSNFEKYSFHRCHENEMTDRRILLGWLDRMEEYAKDLQRIRAAPQLYSFNGNDEDMFDQSSGVAGLQVYRKKKDARTPASTARAQLQENRKGSAQGRPQTSASQKIATFDRLAYASKKRGRAAVQQDSLVRRARIHKVTQSREEEGRPESTRNHARALAEAAPVLHEGVPVTQEVEKRLFALAQEQPLYPRPPAPPACTVQAGSVAGKKTIVGKKRLTSEPLSTSCDFPRF